jgi:hypothetical protein
MIHRLERIDMNRLFRITVKIMISTVYRIVGSEHARVLIFHEWTAIKTMVSPKAYVELCSELWGEKWISLKPPLVAPTITWSHESIAQGHISEILRKELALLGSTSEVTH